MAKFKSFPLANIFYTKSDRQRQEIGDLTELKNSIAEVGLINPIVVTREGRLIAGERRYLACRDLGIANVLVQFLDELSPIELERIELDENLRRLNLTWQEQVRGLDRYHALCVEEYGDDWTLLATQDKLGSSDTTISRAVRIAKELYTGNERVLQAPTLAAAANICERIDARKRDEASEEVATLLGQEPPSTNEAERSSVSASTPAKKRSADEAPIIHSDFIDWLRSYKGPRFNLIHCDFPYAVGADDHDQGAHFVHGEYSDAPEDLELLLSFLTGSIFNANVVAESAHMIFWFSHKFYQMIFDTLSDGGWRVNPTPLIWFRSDNVGIIPDHRRMPRQIYESAFLCSRGDRFLVQAKANCFACATTKEYHGSEKPKAMLTHFLSMVTDDTTRLLDPTCGSGNALIVAKTLGSKDVLGIERDENFYENAVRNWKENGNGKE